MASKRAADLRAIYNSAVNAVKGRTVMNNSIKLRDDKLLVVDRHRGNNTTLEYSLRGKDIYVIGAGKAVYGLCEGFLNLLDRYNEQVSEENRVQISSGILSVPYGIETHGDALFAKHNISVYQGAKNNFLDQQSVETTKRIINLIETRIRADNQKKDCLVLSFISGGGSALLALPKPGLTIEEKCHLIKSMAKRGCDIVELNQVRQCLSMVKGGKLADMLLTSNRNVHVLSLIASDIIGDPVDLIASGPTVIKDYGICPAKVALKVVEKHNVALPEKIRALIEAEKAYDVEHENLQNVVIVNNDIALEEAASAARSLGYRVVNMGNDIKGEASLVAKKWAALGNETEVDEGAQGICWLGIGETTVTMPLSCSGLGGRCQEMALVFFVQTMNRKNGLSFLAAGTDGQDGATPAAGCISDGGKEELKSEAVTALESHDSFRFWSKFMPNNLVDTGGPTGVNVMDVYCMIKSKE